MEDTANERKRDRESDRGENRLQRRIKRNGQWKIREKDKRGRGKR